MTACEDFIRRVNQVLPELATTKDLIDIGIFNNDQAAAAARRKNNGPEFFRLNERVIRYPREGIINFLKSSMGNKH